MTRPGRKIAIVLAGLILITAAVVYWPPWQTTTQQQQKQGKGGFRKKGGGGSGQTEAVPVLSIDARTADVPVYLDGVGTARAQHGNSEAAGRRQADFRFLHRRPGSPERFCPGQDRPDHLSGRVRSGGGEEGARCGAARQPEARSRALHQAR